MDGGATCRPRELEPERTQPYWGQRFVHSSQLYPCEDMGSVLFTEWAFMGISSEKLRGPLVPAVYVYELGDILLSADPEASLCPCFQTREFAM